MASQDNLFDTFRAGEIDAAELSEIAVWHFHNVHENSPTEVLFGLGSDHVTYALKFVYQRHRLKQILAGPALTTEDIDAIRAKVDVELRQPVPVKIGTQVLFSVSRVTGWFRYRDTLQILPVPTGSRRGFGYGGEPFLVQFKFRGSSESMLNQLRREAEVRRVHLLLNALLELGITRLRGSRHHWVVLPTGVTDPMMTAYCQEMYAFPPGLTTLPSSDDFRGDSYAPIGGLDPIVGIEPSIYFTRGRVLDSLDRQLEAPSNLETLLDRFYSSSSDEQDRFLRACFWLYHAQTVFADSTSAGFTALISAIESLMPDPEPIGTCPICKRTVGKGSTRRLEEFLDEFAPSAPTFQQSRAKLYKFRSQLSHGGALTLSDHSPFTFGGVTSQANEERRLSGELEQLVRVVLVNWLHRRSPLLLNLQLG
jgi:hypothetical protein